MSAVALVTPSRDGRLFSSEAAQPAAPVRAEDQIAPRSARSGEPLPPTAVPDPLRGHDFGDVRIHADSDAARSADSLDATAYTVGTDIYFSAGSYRPETVEGRALLAHELAHLRQNQVWGDTGSRVAVSDPGGAAEREADRIGRAAGAARPPAAVPRTPARPDARVQRQVKQIHEKAPLPGEHPEVAGIPNVTLRNTYRQVGRHGQMFRRWMIEAAVEEALVRERMRERGEEMPQPDPVIRPEGSPPPIEMLFSDPTPIAMDLVISNPTLLRALESVPDEVASRYLELLGQRLLESAADLLRTDPAFRREVQEALQRRRQQRERRRRTPVPAEPFEPGGGGTRTG